MQTEAILAKLQAEREAGKPVIVSGVGSGLTAKAACSGGADLLAVYNVAVYRIRGLPTALAFLPYDNANELTMAAAPEVLANSGDLPVIFGFGAHDPRNHPDALVQRAFTAGAAGVTNEPFLGLYGDELRLQLETAGLGFLREVALLKACVERGGLALSWVFSVEQAQAMAQAGIQIIGVVSGVTSGGNAGGAATTSLSATIDLIRAVVQALKQDHKKTFVLGHGGPLNDPASVGVMLRETGADGYATGSTGERMPVEAGVAQAVRQFKSLSLSKT
jgi:predicted TIM-barrel enzyme